MVIVFSLASWLLHMCQSPIKSLTSTYSYSINPLKRTQQVCIMHILLNHYSCCTVNSSAVPTVEATDAVASTKIDAAQLKRLIIVYKISRYKLATRFADSFAIIIAITRSALLTQMHHKPFGSRAPSGRIINKQYVFYLVLWRSGRSTGHSRCK